MRLRIDFPGFKEASWRLLGSQWEGKREGFKLKELNQTRLSPLAGAADIQLPCGQSPPPCLVELLRLVSCTLRFAVFDICFEFLGICNKVSFCNTF